MATQNSKPQVPTKFSFSVGGGGILGNPKLKVPSPDQFFFFGGRGGGEVRGILGGVIPKPSKFPMRSSNPGGGGGSSLPRIAQLALASQIVSYTMCVETN